MYAHAYNCTLAYKNNGLLRGRQKALYLCNRTVLGKTQHLKQCPRSTKAVGIVIWPHCSLGLQISGNRQTHTQTNTSLRMRADGQQQQKRMRAEG